MMKNEILCEYSPAEPLASEATCVSNKHSSNSKPISLSTSLSTIFKGSSCSSRLFDFFNLFLKTTMKLKHKANVPASSLPACARLLCLVHPHKQATQSENLCPNAEEDFNTMPLPPKLSFSAPLSLASP